MRFAVVLVDAPYHAVFAELVTCLAWGLQELGHDVSHVTFPDPSRRNLVVAPHLLLSSVEGEAWRPPPGTIVYNFEPASSLLFTRSLRLLTAKNVTSWDYSPATTQFLTDLGVDTRHVPFAYAPPLASLPAAGRVHVVDVVFVGSYSPRREELLRALLEERLTVRHAFGAFGAERDSLLLRAKCVLNVHFAPGSPTEDLRVLTAAANGLCVASEGPPDHPRKEHWARWAPYESLAAATADLVRSGDWMLQAERGRAAAAGGLQMVDVLREALE